MAIPAPHFDRLIRSLHRRLVFLRAAERIGACLLIGSGGAALLLPFLWWQGGPAFPLVLFALAIACGTGLLMATLRRPTKLDAAMEADHQLNLHDLLSTALLVSGPLSPGTPGERVRVRGSSSSVEPQTVRTTNAPPDPWAATVLSIADARCRDLSPSKVLLHRWGSRAWGGVGLALSLVLTLALFANRSAPTQAATDLFATPDNLGVPRSTQPSVVYSPTHPPSLQRPSDSNDNTSAETASGQTTDTTTTDKSPSASAASATANPSSSGDPTAAGAGASGTSRPPSVLPTLPNAASRTTTGGHGPTATGGQADSQNDGRNVGVSAKSGVSGAQQPLPPAAPWAAPNWPADQDRAMDQIRSGPTYDPYRDLIRAYFNRPP